MLVCAGCNASQPQAHQEAPVATARPSASPSPTKQGAPRVSPAGMGPRAALHALAVAAHARHVAGPATGRTGRYAAYTVIRPLPHVVTHKGTAYSRSDLLIIRRWVNGRWIVDGRLRGHIETPDKLVDFPGNGIAMTSINGADDEAPTITGAEGGAGGYGFMVAARVQGTWQWIRFDGCPIASSCGPLLAHATVTADGGVRHHLVVSNANDCVPNCPMGLQYIDHWVWDPTSRSFVIARRHDLPRGHGWSRFPRRLIRRYVTRHHLAR